MDSEYTSTDEKIDNTIDERYEQKVLGRRSHDSREIVVRNIQRYIFFFQAEDGIRDVERSRGLGDVYKRQTTGVSPGRCSQVCHP